VERLFDWGDSEAINWAAFYSDCEHEVIQVTKGHRITLTYNLYVSEHRGAVLTKFSIVNPSLYPLYDKVKAILSQPGFMKEGQFSQSVPHQYIFLNLVRWNFGILLCSSICTRNERCICPTPMGPQEHRYGNPHCFPKSWSRGQGWSNQATP
jgi:hypothetical protein